MRVPDGDLERVFLTVHFRPLGYEPTRVVARLFCTMIYALLVPISACVLWGQPGYYTDDPA